MNDSYLFELVCCAFCKHDISFSKRITVKPVGGEYRLEKLVRECEIRMDKPTVKQNGKWHCNVYDVIKNIRL